MIASKEKAERKHSSMMDKYEIRMIRKAINKRMNQIECGLIFSRHSQERMVERKVKIKDVMNVFENYTIVEFTNDCINGENLHRVVLRGKQNIDGSNIVLSYCFEKNAVVTVWKNRVDNNHENLNKKLYTLDKVRVKGL
mgnify:CR=1 FL=1